VEVQRKKGRIFILLVVEFVTRHIIGWIFYHYTGGFYSVVNGGLNNKAMGDLSMAMRELSQSRT
jgi:hypothetical protein